MTIRRMHHVGVVVDDLPAATAFFVELGFELESEMSVGDERVDRIVGLEGVQSDVAMVKTPDGHSRLELIRFNAPPARESDAAAPANTQGLRHIALLVDDVDATLTRLRTHGAELVGEVVDYGSSYRLCYVRGPSGIIVELAEEIG